MGCSDTAFVTFIVLSSPREADLALASVPTLVRLCRATWLALARLLRPR